MINCIAVDDEPLALDLLEDNIKRIPGLNLLKKCKNAFEAAQIVQEESVDLIFLDIQMPGITGMQFIKTLVKIPMVIFITAYDKYAVDGYDLNVIDYLIKPVAYERFLKAVNKAMDYHRLQSNAENDEIKYIFVYSEYNLLKLKIDSITHIEGLKDYVKIFCTNQSKPILTRLSLKSVEEKLRNEKFVRVHKSFVVSIDKIDFIRNNRIHLGDIDVPLSDHYKEDFLKILGSTGIRF